MKKHKRIYISGKITDLSYEEAFALFEEAERKATHLATETVNPMKIPIDEKEPTWNQYMVNDIKELFECDAIWMMSNWKNSKGARIEFAIAKEIGIDIYHEKDISDSEPKASN